MADSIPRISIIIPAYNASRYLVRSLSAIASSDVPAHELILIDDCSTDDTVTLATNYTASVLRLDRQSGPSAARNAGASIARGEVLVFIDADVEVHPATIRQLHDHLSARPAHAAVFGSYDATPSDRHLVSSFKNLMHHYVHQNGNPDAQTFWTGCGAIRREIFKALGPFNEVTLTCVEDIDYGHRLRDAGHYIALRPDIQCKHLKRWTFCNLLKADILHRGIPWTVMMLRRGKADNDLNLGFREKLSAIVSLIIPMSVAVSFFAGGEWLILTVLGLILFFQLQKRFYQFLTQQRGIPFALACFPLHCLYYWYSGLSLVLGILIYYLTRYWATLCS